MKVCTVHAITFPTMANMSETHNTLVRSALCCPPRLSHCGDGPARHMAAQAPLLVYVRKPITIGACRGSPDIILSLSQLHLAATSPCGSPTRHRGLQTDIVRACSGWPLYGHNLRAQRVGIDRSQYVPARTLILVRQHEHAFSDVQG